MSIGMTTSGANGPSGVSQVEIQAWAANTNVIFYNLEADWLARMSAAYADEIIRSDDNDTAPPFTK
jgi:hypothetical protein